MKKILLTAMMVCMFLGFSINVKAQENNSNSYFFYNISPANSSSRCFDVFYNNLNHSEEAQLFKINLLKSNKSYFYLVDKNSFSVSKALEVTSYFNVNEEEKYKIKSYIDIISLRPDLNNHPNTSLVNSSSVCENNKYIKSNTCYYKIIAIESADSLYSYNNYKGDYYEFTSDLNITAENVLKSIFNGALDGALIEQEEQIDESLVIKGLQYETVSSFLKGKKTIFSWTIASAFENDTKLDIEFEVDGELISGGSLKIPFKRIKPYENNFFSDKDGTYEFYNNTVIPAVQKSIPNYSPNVLDKINILNYYCRYRRTNANGTFTYGLWQRIGDDIPEIEDFDNAIYEETLDLKHIGVLFTTPNVQAILNGDTQKLMWKSLNSISNAYLRVEANCRYYDKVAIEVGTPNNSKPIFTKYIDSNCLLYDSNNKLLTVKKQELIREDYLRQRFCNQNNVFVDGYSCVAKEYYVTNYAIIDGELKRSRCYKIDVINVANGRVTGKGYSGTIDSDSSHFIEDTSDPNFERDKIISKEDEDGNSILVKDPDIDDTFFPPKPPIPNDPDNSNTSDIPILNLETLSNLFYNVGQFFLWVINSLTNLVSLVGRLPFLFSQVFSFLPNMVTQSMGVTIIVSFIFRIIGR